MLASTQLLKDVEITMKYYAGIGSRETPNDILDLMYYLATKLRDTGWTLRSGGAKGADTAFERAAGAIKEIFKADDATPEAIELASQFHPAWGRCTDYVRKLHGRNAMIILGSDLITPVQFVMCWTPGGAYGVMPRGGTALGMRIAQGNGISVKNLYDQDQVDKVNVLLSGSDGN